MVDETNDMVDATIHRPSLIVETNLATTNSNSNSIEIRKISLPRKNIVKGRPKGSGRTVVGTKKKVKKNASRTIATEQASSIGRVTRSANKVLARDVQSKGMRLKR